MEPTCEDEPGVPMTKDELCLSLAEEVGKLSSEIEQLRKSLETKSSYCESIGKELDHVYRSIDQALVQVEIGYAYATLSIHAKHLLSDTNRISVDGYAMVKHFLIQAQAERVPF